MPITKKTSKNQITIPKQIADRFEGVEYFEVLPGKQEIILRPVKLGQTEDKLSLIRDRMSRLGIKRSDIEAAVRWARAK